MWKSFLHAEKSSGGIILAKKQAKTPKNLLFCRSNVNMIRHNLTGFRRDAENGHRDGHAPQSARCFPPSRIASSATRSTVAFFVAFSLIHQQTHQKSIGFCQAVCYHCHESML